MSENRFLHFYGNKKGKAIPAQAWTSPESSALTPHPPTPQEVFLVLFSVRGRFDPRAKMRPEKFQ